MEEGEVCMKRILVLLSVVALMVVMLAMSVAPAFARYPSDYRCAILIDNYYLRGELGNIPPSCFK
jgi:hypothetical protein